ncbi:hypothetical protein D3C73_1029430 [compost metagenome]
MVEAEIKQYRMIVPVIAVVQRNRHQLLAVAGGRADQTAQRFFGVPGLNPIGPFVQAQHFIFVAPFVVPLIIRIVGCLHLCGYNFFEYRIMQRIGCQHRQIIGARVMPFGIQPVRIGKMRMGQPQLLCLGIHQVDEAFLRSADMFGDCRSRIISRPQHQAV